MSPFNSDNDNGNVEFNPSTIDSNNAEEDSPAGETNDDQQLARLKSESNYSTVSRWEYRMELWSKYLKNPEQFPEAHEYLYSLPTGDTPPGNNVPIEYLIWGQDKDSLKSLQKGPERLQSEFEVLTGSKDTSTVEPSPTLPSDPSLNIHEKESNHESRTASLPADPIQDENRRLKEIIKAQQEQLIQKSRTIKAQQEQLLHERAQNIQKSRTIKEKQEDNIRKSFFGIYQVHARMRNTLSSLADKADVDKITKTTSDSNFLSSLLKKSNISPQKQDHLCKLQAFVTALFENSTPCPKKMKSCDQDKIKATVDAILDWEPERTSESLLAEEKRFGRPPPQGCETGADQPILWALIFRILEILDPSSRSVKNEKGGAFAVSVSSKQGEAPRRTVRSEQVVAPLGRGGRGRRIDFLIDQPREFLHVLFPAMIGIPIEVKPAATDDATTFEKNQRKAREQVISHLAKQLTCAFNFGGIGEEIFVRGIVLSTISVQVLEMGLTGIGTTTVKIVFRQTPHVPLLGTRVSRKIQDKVAWDMEENGILLLASAMLDLPQKSMFGSHEEHITTFHDISANNHASDQDVDVNVDLKIESFLGSGGFAHVVELCDGTFMKIPKSQLLLPSLLRECETLSKLGRVADNEKPWFPRTMAWGVSDVHLFIRNEISNMKVLRLTGIIGRSLGSCCSEMQDRDIDFAIGEVYRALEFAHSHGIFHMDVRPSNIIVGASNLKDVQPQPEGASNTKKGQPVGVLLADWGCSMFENDKIKQTSFVGCPPYAHDELLRKRNSSTTPQASFDFASLGYTWYHVRRKVLDWKFDRALQVPAEKLKQRQKYMEMFFQHDIGDDKSCLVSQVHKIFKPSGNESAGLV